MKVKREKPRTSEEYRQVIAERVAVLVNTFGESDARVHQVKHRLIDLCDASASPSAANWHIAALYAAWATKNPGEICREPTYDCTCGGGKGWVSEVDETGKVVAMRPCSRCNQDIFSFCYEKGGALPFTPGIAPKVEGSRGSGDSIPPMEEPPWDDM